MDKCNHQEFLDGYCPNCAPPKESPRIPGLDFDHYSSCSLHNAPALPVGPCDCGRPEEKAKMKSPGLDKLEEGLFCELVLTVEGHDIHVGGEALLSSVKASFAQSKEFVESINKAHTSIVKPLREKAERAEESRAGWKAQADRNESIAGDALKQLDEMRKDRDAWKEKAERLTKDIETGFMAGAYARLQNLQEKERAYDDLKADADRLAEALKELSDECFRCDQQDEQVDGSFIDKAWAALKAHEKLVGGSKKEG